MSLRLYERTVKELPSRADIYLEKRFLFDRDKPLIVKADLDQESYTENDTVTVHLAITRPGPKGHGIRKIKIEIFQQVTFSIMAHRRSRSPGGFAQPVREPVRRWRILGWVRSG